MEDLFTTNCYIAEDGTVYAPNIEDGVVIETGEQVYSRHQVEQQIDICSELTTEEKLQSLTEQVNLIDLTVADLLLNI